MVYSLIYHSCQSISIQGSNHPVYNHYSCTPLAGSSAWTSPIDEEVSVCASQRTLTCYPIAPAAETRVRLRSAGRLTRCCKGQLHHRPQH